MNCKLLDGKRKEKLIIVTILISVSYLLMSWNINNNQLILEGLIRKYKALSTYGKSP